MNLILVTALIMLMVSIAGCGSDVKTPKYPGQTDEVGTPQEGSDAAPTDMTDGTTTETPAGTPGAGAGISMTPPGGDGTSDSGKSATPVAPFGAEPVARPLQQDAPDDEETSSDDTDEAAEEEVTEEESTEEEAAEEEPAEEESTRPERKEQPSYYNQLGTFSFPYNDASEGQVGALNEMLTAIDILTVNEQKYEHAEAYLTAEAEGLSRGDPLFIPEAVPDELRPLIAGEGISGALDQELLELFRSSVQADLRSIPMWIIGVMEQGGTKIAIGTISGTMKFKVGQGQQIRMWYSGWYALGITGTLISEDLVILNLVLLQFNGRSFTAITDPVPRSFHVGIT